MNIQLNPSDQPVLASLLDMKFDIIYKNIRAETLVIRCNTSHFIYLSQPTYPNRIWFKTIDDIAPSDLSTKEWILYEGSVTLSNHK